MRCLHGRNCGTLLDGRKSVVVSYRASSPNPVRLIRGMGGPTVPYWDHVARTGRIAGRVPQSPNIIGLTSPLRGG